MKKSFETPEVSLVNMNIEQAILTTSITAGEKGLDNDGQILTNKLNASWTNWKK